MERLETEILAALGVADPYADTDRGRAARPRTTASLQAPGGLDP